LKIEAIVQHLPFSKLFADKRQSGCSKKKLSKGKECGSGLSSHCKGESCILLQTMAAKEAMPMPLWKIHLDNSVCQG